MCNSSVHASQNEITCLFTAGVGGQIDFIRGAALGLDGLGKPIIAIPSRTKHDEPKIVPIIKTGKNMNSCLNITYDVLSM